MESKVVNFNNKRLSKEISDLRNHILNILPEDVHPADASKISFLTVYAGYDMVRGLLGFVEKDQQNKMAEVTITNFFNILTEFKSLLEKDHGSINLDLKLVRKRKVKNADKEKL